MMSLTKHPKWKILLINVYLNQATLFYAMIKKQSMNLLCTSYSIHSHMNCSNNLEFICCHNMDDDHLHAFIRYCNMAARSLPRA